jgi:hypothetical protein
MRPSLSPILALAFGALAAVGAAGCASSSPAPRAATASPAPAAAARPLTLTTAEHQIVAELAVDGAITDGNGRVVTRYDALAQSMPLDGGVLSVRDSVHATGPRELDVHPGPLGPWHVRVIAGDDLEVDGKPFGHIDGFEESPAGLTRLGALLCAVPVLDPR